MFVYEQPTYFYALLLLIPVALIFLWNRFWSSRAMKRFGDVHLVKKLVPEQSAFKTWIKFVSFSLAALALVIALVNPKIGTRTETVKREGIDIVFAVDISKSMLAEDVSPNRLEKSKQIVSQIINQLAGDRVGIVAYAGSAFPVLPITSDYAAAKMFLQSMNTNMISEQGTSFDLAIELASTYFDQDSSVSRLMILISDGEDHSEGLAQSLEILKEKNIKTITIGVGTEKGGPIPIKRNGVVERFIRDSSDEVVITRLDQTTLQKIAAASKGGYVLGNQTKEVLNYVTQALENIEKTEFETTQISDYNSQFQWFIGFALFWLILDVLFLERRTAWIQRLNLFNEKKQD